MSLCALQGNGFITDWNLIKNYRLSDANPFFSALVDKPYVDRVRGDGFNASLGLKQAV